MSTSPYPGLRPFHRDEADIFFGRDEQVDQLLVKLGQSRFLAAVGASGCGKSSLIHTGLLNALEAGFLAGVGLHWRIATLHPGEHPMRNLAEALVEKAGFWSKTSACVSPAGPEKTGATQAEEKPEGLHERTPLLLANLRRGPLGLIEALREEPLPENTNLLIVVDQFEEIFRYRQHQDRDEADAFVALLLRSVQESEVPIYVVITMRSDFLGDCALFPGLPEALNDSQFLTPRLTREQRRLAITGPAKVFGGEVEPALVNRLLNDMGADPDQLPVLQHALMRLWTLADARDAKPVLLRLEDYEKLGGWDETLSKHADEAYEELNEKQRAIAETLFRLLTERSGPKRDTRRPVSLENIAEVAGIGTQDLIPVIDAFRRGDRSFLMPPEGQALTADTLIDISHESLIRQWRRMKDWVEREAQSAETYRRLEQSALLHGEKRAGLLQGLDLFSVLDWKKREKPGAAWASRYGGEFDRAMGFLAASDRRQTLKSILKLLGVGVIFIIAILMTWLWRKAETERNQAISARALAQAQLLRSQDSLNESSILLGLEAMKRNPHPKFVLSQFLRNSLGMLPQPGPVLQHDDSVSDFVYSPDGKQLATASEDKTVRLWDSATGKEQQRLKHDDPVRAVSFSPDGKRLVSASDDKTARLWDAATGKELRRLKPDGIVKIVVFSPDGQQLVTATEDKTVQLWEVTTGRELQRLKPDGFVRAVTFSSDGRQLTTVSDDIRLWDTATGQELQRLNHNDFGATFGPDGTRLATYGGSNVVNLLDTATGQELLNLNYGDRVKIVSFSPDGSRIATTTDDDTVRLWDASTGQALQQLRHFGRVNAVTFSPGGKQLATASDDRTARLWDAETGKELQRLNLDDAVRTVTFNPNGKQLATAGGNHAVRLWDISIGQAFQRLSHGGAVNDVTFSPDGKQIATASSDNTARLWDTATAAELQRLSYDGFDSDPYRRKITIVAFSPNGKQLATASENVSQDKAALLWDTTTGKELQRLLGHDFDVNAVAYSPDGKRLATASDDNTARLWDTTTGQELQRLNHDDNVNAVAYSPDGKRLATASDDNTARLWDTTTGQELQRLNHDDNINAVAYSPDGKRLATASDDNTARLWDTPSGQEFQRLHHDAGVEAVTFSPDGKRLATISNRSGSETVNLDGTVVARVSERNTVRLWDAATGQALQSLNHEGLVTAVTFGSDGKQLATASWDKTVRLWDVQTGKELQRLSHDDTALAVAFSPDGNKLATASLDDSARLWLWQPEDLIQQICSRLQHNLSWDEWKNAFEDESYRKTCERLPVAPEYQEKGRELVRDGKMAEAIRMVRELNAADPALQLDQEEVLQKWMAPLRLEEAEKRLQEKKITEAIAGFKEAEQMDASIITAKQWNVLCWDGALANSAPQVLFACNRAVAAAKGKQLWNHRDSRGLAHALSGNPQGAIEDFEFYIGKTDDEALKKQRRDWVTALRAGQNPFSKEMLESIRGQ